MIHLALGIESTCDETAASLVSFDGEVFSNHAGYQTCHYLKGGVVPSLASGCHVQNIKGVVKVAMGSDLRKMSHIFVSTSPGLIGGLVIGSVFAQNLGLILNVPVSGINHLEGHILSGELLNSPYQFPVLIVLLTGGNTMLVLTYGVGKYRILSKTVDDAVGEAFDKVARMLGLPYPGGPQVEMYARNGIVDFAKYPMPTRVNYGEMNFSFSGMKTAVRVMIDKLKTLKSLDIQTISDVCATFQEAIALIIIEKLSLAISADKENTIKKIVMVGGVAANDCIFLRVSDHIERQFFGNKQVIRADKKFCGDNGAMIAWAGIRRLKAGLSLMEPNLVSAKSNL